MLTFFLKPCYKPCNLLKGVKNRDIEKTVTGLITCTGIFLSAVQIKYHKIGHTVKYFGQFTATVYWLTTVFEYSWINHGFLCEFIFL